MRMYHLLKNDENSVLYEYRYETNEGPYTGMVEYNKQEKTAKLLKAADKERFPERAAAYVQITLAKKGFPERYTHTAS